MGRRDFKYILFHILLLSACFAACGGTDDPSQNPDPTEPETLQVNVKGTMPHDTSSFTQGLEVHEGVLWESSGLYGSSMLRRLDLSDGSVMNTYPLPDTLFAEGITVVGGDIYQLTWLSGLVLKWDVADPVMEITGSIQGEGWGMCSSSGSTVVTSDGSSTLSFRDISTFDTLYTIDVNCSGESVDLLNELEYAGGYIYANRYYSDYIYRIDPSSGNVTALIDASQLRSMINILDAGVLNGIAWDPDRSSFLLTGKNWPLIFVVDFE